MEILFSFDKLCFVSPRLPMRFLEMRLNVACTFCMYKRLCFIFACASTAFISLFFKPRVSTEHVITFRIAIGA